MSPFPTSMNETSAVMSSLADSGSSLTVDMLERARESLTANGWEVEQAPNIHYAPITWHAVQNNSYYLNVNASVAGDGIDSRELRKFAYDARLTEKSIKYRERLGAKALKKIIMNKKYSEETLMQNGWLI